MKTMPDTSSQAAAFRQLASSEDAFRFVNRMLHRIQSPRRIKATLLRPFHAMLRPFIHPSPGVKPRLALPAVNASWEAVVLGALLLPLAFVLLLPLLIIIFPLVVLAGLGALMMSAVADSRPLTT
jgi:hypothetical protein